MTPRERNARGLMKAVREKACKTEVWLRQAEHHRSIDSDFEAAFRFQAAEAAHWAQVQARIALGLRPVVPEARGVSYDVEFDGTAAQPLGPRGTWFGKVLVDGVIVESLPRPSRLTAMIAAVMRGDELREVSRAKACTPLEIFDLEYTPAMRSAA